MEIRRFGVGHRRPDGPPGTTRVAGQVIHSDGRGAISELAFLSWTLPLLASLTARSTTGPISASVFPAFFICTALIRSAPESEKFTNERLASSFSFAPVFELGFVAAIPAAP